MKNILRLLIGLPHRALWHLNRTPLRWAIKAGVSAIHWRAKAERRHIAGDRVLTAEAQARIDAFQREGYAVITDLVDDRLLHDMATASEQKMLNAKDRILHQTITHKSFWIRLLDEDMQQGRMGTDNAFVRFAIQPRVLDLMCAAFGELPLLVDVLLALSQETATKLSYSQLWHRDYDDPRTIKLFVYLTDVTNTDDGPFTFIPKQESDKFGFSLKSHMPDEKIFRIIDKKSVREMLGPRLTVFMVETSRCLHMGSRMKPGHSRLLYSAIYVSTPRVYPVKGRRFLAVPPLSPEQQLILG